RPRHHARPSAPARRTSRSRARHRRRDGGDGALRCDGGREARGMSERGDPGEASVRRLLVVDDHPIVRQGVRLLLESEPDLTVCAEAENTRDALRAAAASEPDVAIVDLSLPGAGGLELIRAL